jgi:hypothetical protein
MICDEVALNSAQASWSTVRNMQAMLRTHATAPPLSPFGFLRSPDYDKVAFSLLVLNAFGVLEEVLEQLRSERVFKCHHRTLAELMKNSVTALPWAAYSAVNIARGFRNQIAHEQKMLSPSRCDEILNLIENELVNWRVLPHSIKGKYSISIGGATDAEQSGQPEPPTTSDLSS